MTDTVHDLHEHHGPIAVGVPYVSLSAPRQDSVIPNETQGNLSPPVLQSAQGTPVLMSNLNGILSQHAINAEIPNLDPRRQGQLRRELFKLLLSYLNDINQFQSRRQDHSSEQRLDALLWNFWIDDAESLQSRIGGRFARLDVAFRAWLDMRSRVTEFQTTTGYFGQSGEEWTAYLRNITERQDHAQACIAFVKLKDMSGEEHREAVPQIDKATLNKDLAMVFDFLTNIQGCNGVEAFEGLTAFNEALLRWFP